MDSAGPIDWSTALRGWTFADVLTAFEALPESLQQPLHAALTTAPKPVPPPAPWAVAGGSVSWLLDELGLSGLYGSTFAEYGVETVAQMLGPEGGDPSALIASLRELGVTRDHRDKIERLARSPRPCGASGGCFDRAFLAACRPLHAQHMGCENMGPLLYSLVRFTKAQGGGRAGGRAALADNDAELAACAAAVATDGYTVAQADWMADAGAATEAAAAEAAAGGGACGGGGSDGGDGAGGGGSRFWVSAACERGASMLHAIDDMGAAEGGNRGSAHLIEEAAERLGLRRHLRLHQGDAYEMAGAPLSDGDGDASQAEGDGSPAAAAADLDVLWLDFGLGGSTRIGALASHFSPTSPARSAAAQRERRSEAASDVAATRCGHLCEFETLSLLEPHKRYQNSVSIFQKRDGGWAEPLHTMYP
ncbi:hypothetical protein EMIHUDRAFT_99558 [Emiliania huxleyi CCMP1516]|uniref:SAM domain-containing protein n=2 Tax=Emiliania huxleyi TaxID=2903 RepID=A0A0D3K2U8_EMIH1|nr:hypothetical protein EMIHUDRAFT_99558 [Emiliania huxleyi CCMP1516]EOD30083.1 hypothetical protein EMIHUDRAFT_99558 [Emiliania huxleyi CCMP1516]|eukprot:XP_005782512.1 hypothetical protein EMIHUDRAFT_99558 [Emiliania huxleyi CCMP1516]